MKQITMSPLTQNLSILKKINFDRQPVGIKYLYSKPDIKYG
ncbi:hypothetical protein ACFL1N_15600 [Thermodesulfobacteriota bacterium]